MLRSNILKVCLFATGLAGIVAEYILSTLATYFLGDSVLQWTMIVSIMLFSMGLGSRLSKYFASGLLQKFIYIEFILSVFVSFSSLLAYTFAAYTTYEGFIIYALSIIIGTLIGLEIPLVVRLNEEFESLRVNIASVIEKDYYGSLAGGLFFAFFALPYLGLTYTPFVLGMINFLVALVLFIFTAATLRRVLRIRVITLAIATVLVLVSGFFLAKPIILHAEQAKYKDKVIYTEQSRYQRIVITQWKDQYWLYIDGNQQLCTLDEAQYHEPLVHPVMSMCKTPYSILVMGGGDGCAVREILKYKDVKSITLVDLDPAMTRLGQTNPIITKLNRNALNDPKVKIINEDGFHYIEKALDFFDAIIIDLPDPRTVELGRLYSQEFYWLCNKHLRPHGVIITQAGSPYYATQAFLCIDKTVSAAGFTTQMMHNQVLSFGEWGWVLGVKNMQDTLPKSDLKNMLLRLQFDSLETKWLNNEAMALITSFGKDIYAYKVKEPEINTIQNPVLYKYYLDGNWDLY